MATSLERLAKMLLDGHPAERAERLAGARPGRPLRSPCPWHELRYAHTQTLRSWLAEHCSLVTANRHLAALRGVLRKAWRLGLMKGEDLGRAIDLTSIPGTSLQPAATSKTARSAAWLPPAWPTTPPAAAETPPCSPPSSWVACAGPRRSPSTSGTTTPPPATSP